MPKKQTKIRLEWLLPLALVVGFFAVRAPALGRFVTTDEALWLRRSANFYLAISKGDWASTFQTEHPGLVTQWAGAAGFWLKFPDYAHVGEPEVHDAELIRLMENRGVSPMEVLAAGRLVLVLLHTAAFAALWPFARRLLGMPTAAMGMALIAFDPFLIAHQRLLHLDGLLASLMLLSVLALLDFLQSRKKYSLVVSAIATGLTMLTKTPGWFLLPFGGLLVIWQIWRGPHPAPCFARRTLPLFKGKGWRLKSVLAYASWLLIAFVILFVFFPALWIAPLQTLQQMFAYALGSAKGEFSGPLFFNGVIYPDGNFGLLGFMFYPVAFLWRSTPLTLVGLAMAIYAIFLSRQRKKSASKQVGKYTSTQGGSQTAFGTIAWLFAFGILFLTFMTLADKKFDRYILPAVPALLLIAGWGWWQITQSFPTLQKKTWGTAVALVAIGTLQLASALPTFPYYLSYYDPVLGGSKAAPRVMQIGWGEGLDQAAAYLKQHPGGTVAAWYSTAFNLMFNGQADDIPVVTELPQTQLDDLLAHDYLVVYEHQWRRGTPQNLLDALRGKRPEYVVNINGIEYVRVYHLTR